MRTHGLSWAAALLSMLLTAPARAEETSDYVWQSDQHVRQAGLATRQPADDIPKIGAEKAAPLPVVPKAPIKAIVKPQEGTPPSQGADSAPKRLPGTGDTPSAPPSKPLAPATSLAPQTSAGSAPQRLPADPAYAAPREVPKSPFRDEPSGGPAKPATSPVASTPCPTEVGPEEKKDDEEQKDDEEKEWRLFQCPGLEANRIDVHGWIDQGITFNPSSPSNQFNGPIGYNDRSNDYMLNQVYLVMERLTKTDDCEWDVGGRADLLYGEDHRFVTAAGLDSDLTSSKYYGLALPQMYADLAYDKWIFRAGHFLYPNGNEAVTAPDNFFYSHSYTFLYGEPTTFTGGQIRYKFNDKLTVYGGIDTGWNDWTSPNGQNGYFVGLNWNPDDKTTLAFTLSYNTQQLTGVSSSRTHYDLVLTHKLSDKLTYAFENTFGSDSLVAGSGPSENWCSFVNYLTYDLCDKWSVGGRWEWMKDNEGIIVPPSDPFPFAAAVPYPGAPGEWNDLSLGVNFKPSKNILARTELRYDWESALIPGATAPFNDNTSTHQWTWGNDLIIKF